MCKQVTVCPGDICPPCIIRVMKSRRVRWEGHVARMGERRGACRALVGKPEVRNHLEDRGVGGRIILKWIFDRLDWGGIDGSIWLL